MPVGLLKDIAQDAPRGQALLGLDVGKKTIGLALCDPGWSVATPLFTIKRTKFTKDMEEIKVVMKEHEIGGLVIGLPVNMDGSEGPRAQSVRDFALEMERHLLSFRTPQAKKSQKAEGDSSHALGMTGGQIWIALWDERLSTVSVEESVDNYVEKRKIKVESKSSGLIDKLAAQVILQGAIDALNFI